MADGPERPYLLALASALGAIAVGGAVLAWGTAQPERVVVGRAGHHDGRVRGGGGSVPLGAPSGDDPGAHDGRVGSAAGGRHAACLDCHVPFVGTPASRCLGPGCHGELATGSPPKTGPAMPVRFHVALRDEPCELCHAEHDDQPDAAPRAFTHALIPEPRRTECRRCHGAATVPAHSRTDAVGCGTCHGLQAWTGTPVDHAVVAAVHCDVCHQAPSTPTHGTLAGTCGTCHETASWTPRAAPPDGAAPP